MNSHRAEDDPRILQWERAALHGIGGRVFDAHRNSFVNVLGRWNYVTGEMWKNKSPFRLVVYMAGFL